MVEKSCFVLIIINREWHFEAALDFINDANGEKGHVALYS